MIVQYPDEILRRTSELVVDGEPVVDIVGQMKGELDKTNGLGIAAVQIGVLKSIIIIRDVGTGVDTVMINPIIVSHSEEQVSSEEGCLSIGEGKPRCKIKRYKSVDVRYQDLNFETHSEQCEGLRALIVQHEIDHCNGTLIIDRLSRLKRSMFTKKLK